MLGTVHYYHLIRFDLSVSSSSWGLGRDAVCDCGTPWTSLTFFLVSEKVVHQVRFVRVVSVNVSILFQCRNKRFRQGGCEYKRF